MQRRRQGDIQSADWTNTKANPRSRPAHEAGHSGALINADPNKKYVLVPKADNVEFNYSYYQDMGYQVELKTKDGVKIHLGTNVGEGKPLEWRGNVLMSCSAERAKEIFEKGPTGNTGQNYFNTLMQKIRKDPTDKKPHERVQGLREYYQINDPDDINSGIFR